MTRLFLAILLFTALIGSAEASDFTTRYTPAAVPKRVPSFTFNDSNGRTLDLGDFKGRYVLLNLWATWCGPCVREMPGLDALQQKISSKRLTVLAVSEDHEGINAAMSFYKRHELSHLPVLADQSGRAPSLLHVDGLPTTLLIDPNGMEIGRIEGDADWDDSDTIAYLEKLMKRSAPPAAHSATR